MDMRFRPSTGEQHCQVQGGGATACGSGCAANAASPEAAAAAQQQVESGDGVKLFIFFLSACVAFVPDLLNSYANNTRQDVNFAEQRPEDIKQELREVKAAVGRLSSKLDALGLLLGFVATLVVCFGR
ncbi:unnamed protein product [Symbiodinium natans]|uniref:Uncharacterized protein n=1 Tax=Symbiodinium natans TaxID=878477 RepID=A0A812JGC2_9DINO|nr:unnamed protein product [Symbiodinium natans]